MRSLPVVTCLLLSLALVGCGEEDAIGRAYRGQANVRSGPSAPLEIKGDIFFFDGPAGIGSALLPDGATSSVRVGATVVNGRITLEIPATGGTIVGTGPFTGDFRAPARTLEGDLVGPTAGDSGDWAFSLVEIGIALNRATCFAACSYAGYSDSKCNSTCGTDR